MHGIAALGLMVAGPITNSGGVLVYLAAVAVVIWVVTTAHHALGGRPAVSKPAGR